MSKRGRSCLVLAAGLVLAAVATAPAWGANPPAPDAQIQPLKDGCQRSPAALLTRESPEWVYVYNDKTKAGGPPPPPQWVTGVASSHNPAYQAVHTSGGDLPTGHKSYDYNVNILPDAAHTFLVGSANYLGNGEETGRLHTEWEDLTVAKSAWAEPGDRVTERGSWVWDCGHWGTPTNVFSPDYLLPKEGQPCPGVVNPDPKQCTVSGEGTEFHPYRAVWVERAQSASSPYGENQGDLFVSTDKTPAGTEADCAHKHPPPAAPPPLKPFLYGPDYRLCLETDPNWQDVSGDYSFRLPAPPRTRPGSRLVFRAVNQGSAGAPAPKLTADGNGVRVTFHLSTTPGQRLVMAYRFFVGWSPGVQSTLPTHLRVTFQKLEIHRAMDPGCSLGRPVPGCADESTRENQATVAPGDWNLYWDVNGIWGQWAPGNGEFLPKDGDTLTPPGALKPVDLYVPPGKGWRLFVHGRECDLNDVEPTDPMADCPSNHELADDNDVTGMVLDTYPSADASIGTHRSNALTRKADPTSTCPDTNKEACYSLSYTVTRIDDAAQRLLEPRRP